MSFASDEDFVTRANFEAGKALSKNEISALKLEISHLQERIDLLESAITAYNVAADLKTCRQAAEDVTNST